MKKLIFSLVAVAAFAALADDPVPAYQALYWQVTADSLGEYADATYANLYATLDGGTIRVAVDENVKGASGFAELSEELYINPLAVNLNGWNGGAALDGAMFYVELLNDGGAFMAQSAGISYANLLSYIDKNYSGAGIPATATGVAVFTSYAVPEPTSGLLMLLGFAGLALRRKRS